METINFDKFTESIKPKKINLVWLLIIGVALMTLSHLTWNGYATKSWTIS